MRKDKRPTKEKINSHIICTTEKLRNRKVIKETAHRKNRKVTQQKG